MDSVDEVLSEFGRGVEVGYFCRVNDFGGLYFASSHKPKGEVFRFPWYIRESSVLYVVVFRIL
jgi:hypothetical protein